MGRSLVITLSFWSQCFPNLWNYITKQFNECSLPCIFLGYSDKHKGYRCLYSPTRRIYVSRQVIFYEKNFLYVSANHHSNTFQSDNSQWLIGQEDSPRAIRSSPTSKESSALAYSSQLTVQPVLLPSLVIDIANLLKSHCLAQLQLAHKTKNRPSDQISRTLCLLTMGLHPLGFLNPIARST